MKKNNFISGLADCLNEAYRPKGENGLYKNDMDSAFMWFITSMFHDIAYPMEKSNQLMEAFFKRYICPDETDKPVFKQNLNITRAIFNVEYSQSIEELSEIHRKLSHFPNQVDYQTLKDSITLEKDPHFRYKIITQILDSQDHGILSAVMLLNRFDKDKNIFKYLFPAVAAISIHNFQWVNRSEFKEPCASCRTKSTGCKKCISWKEEFDKYFEKDTMQRHIDFKTDPMGFLLILCDTLQDWGRYDFENMEHAFDHFYNQSRITDIRMENGNIIFDLTLSPEEVPDKKGNKRDFLFYKKQEIVKIFSRLKFIDGHDIIVNFIQPKGTPIAFSMNSFQ